MITSFIRDSDRSRCLPRRSARRSACQERPRRSAKDVDVAVKELSARLPQARNKMDPAKAIDPASDWLARAVSLFARPCDDPAKSGLRITRQNERTGDSLYSPDSITVASRGLGVTTIGG
jgi:hypothetical protein